MDTQFIHSMSELDSEINFVLADRILKQSLFATKSSYNSGKLMLITNCNPPRRVWN